MCALILTVISVLLLPNWSFATARNCTTPNNTEGYCKVIDNCPQLHNSSATYLSKSQCGFQASLPKVCCPVKDNKPVTVQSTNRLRRSLLPDTSVCGISTQDRITNGESTELDEFPWMALIISESPEDRNKGQFRRILFCGGVLISKRYVLTAAHCIESFPPGWSLTVRLGEYNIDTDPDCLVSRFGTDCAPRAVSIEISQKIIHESYNSEDPTHYHDIGLLRLARIVIFSEFIKPICLPESTKELKKTYIGTKLVVAGWGTTERGTESRVKLKLQIPVKSNSQCDAIYGPLLEGGQLCAGGDKGRDTCYGDSGGPLMTISPDRSSADLRWYAVGVVSSGVKDCGAENKPAVYTKVSMYINWIKRNIWS